MIYDQPDQTRRGEHFAMKDNMSYSTTTVRDRRHREDVPERESGDIPEEGHQLEAAHAAGIIHNLPVQTARREQFAMNDNAAYSTVAKDRRCREGDTERESGEELLLETAGMIYNRSEQAAGGEQFAMNDNMAYSTAARDRRCREGATERESGDIPEEEEALVYKLIFDAKYY